MWDDLFPVALASVLIVWPIYRFVKLDAPAIIKARALIRQWPWIALGFMIGVAGQSNHAAWGLLGTTTKTVFFTGAFSLFVIRCVDARIRTRMRFAEHESPSPPNHGIMQNS